jgi:hypothetical protein
MLKTIILSFIIIFLLQQIFNFICAQFYVPPTHFSAIEKYKKIAEDVGRGGARSPNVHAPAAAAASAAPEQVYDAQIEMEEELFNLVRNST